MIGSVFPMYLENVEYPVIYIVDLAVISRSANDESIKGILIQSAIE